jgi:hypothetical protein
VNLQSLNQKVILKTGFFGFLMGIITVMGWSQQLEPILWLIIGIGTTYVLNKNIKEDLLLHCLIVGLCWGIDCTIIQAVFFDTFSSNNSLYASKFTQFENINPRILILTTGLIAGIISGFALWLFIHLFKKLKP